MLNIRRSTGEYEAWLKKQLGGSLVAKDLAASTRRCARTARSRPACGLLALGGDGLEICPQLASAPSVLAVGDIHLENFGTWRDAEGRLIWGVNDFDEAAEMPVRDRPGAPRRPAPSWHTRVRTHEAEQIALNLLRGYRKGLATPVADRARPPVPLAATGLWSCPRSGAGTSGRE